MGKGVFLNFPTHGCINSLLATASELVARGEQITYYCTEEFRDKIEQTGAVFSQYKGRINDFRIQNFNLAKALRLNIEMTADKVEYNLDDIRKENPDYIIHDSLCTWGKIISSIMKIPAVNLMHSFPIAESSISFNTDTASTLIKVGLYELKNMIKKNPSLKILKNKYGADVRAGDILINKENLNIIYTSKHIEPEIHEKEKTYKFVGPSLFFKKDRIDFPFDKLAGKKIVYISLGTLLTNDTNFYKKCINAFLSKEFYVVISVGFDVDLEAYSDLPYNFLVRQSVPQQKLLEYVDLFISHAGMNSVNEAICYGVPMLLIPHTFEQKMIADRVDEMGIGIVMKKNGLKPERLYENTKKMITDLRYKEKALKYKSIFSGEEKSSHIKAADEILDYVNK